MKEVSILSSIEKQLRLKGEVLVLETEGIIFLYIQHVIYSIFLYIPHFYILQNTVLIYENYISPEVPLDNSS